VPNLLSGARLLAVPVLIVLASQHEDRAFSWLLVAALLTDILDGLVARLFDAVTPLGAMLDSVADTLVLLTGAYGIWALHPEVLRDEWQPIAAILLFWGIETVAAWMRYGRLSSFHTYLSKVTANVLGIFLGVLFVFGFYPWMLYLAAVVSVLASIEELWLLRLLPRWETNVKGVWWVLRRPPQGPA
jgi:CDP-diacylglycerol--glycerol-3-phosphate 3-phosphatidyltransferase